MVASRAWRERVGARSLDLHRPLLVLVLLATFGLRMWGIKQGLPYSYNVDEATHFVPRAIAFFSHDLNPQYFLNPPAYSYLLHIVFELWFGSGDTVSRVYATDPTQVFVVARVVAAVLGTISVWLTYLAGERLFGRTVALLGAADLRGRVPTHLLQPPGAQRRAHAGPGGARALRGGGGPAPWLAAGLRDRWSRDRAGGGDQVHGRDRRSCACWRRRSATGRAARRWSPCGGWCWLRSSRWPPS